MKLPAAQAILPAISTPLSISLADHLTPEEREQILQTIEMFEAIVAAAPEDLSTLEILKEAYWKIGRLADAINTGQQLGTLYERLGQNPAALREYENIHRQLIENADTPIEGNLSDTLVSELELKIAELRDKLRGRSHSHSHGTSHTSASIALDFGSEFDVAIGTPLSTSPVGALTAIDGETISHHTASNAANEHPELSNHSLRPAAKAAPEASPLATSSKGLAFPGAALLFQKESPTSTTAGTAGAPTTPSTPPASLTAHAPASIGGSIPFKLQTEPVASNSVEPPTIANTLIATAATRHPDTALRVTQPVTLGGDGYEPLIKYLIQNNLVAPEIINNAAAQARQFNQSPVHLDGRAPAASLLFELEKAGVPIAPIISALIDRTKFAYVPLEYYDIDRQIVRMLPESLTLARLIVPFDIIGRTMMIAIDNPFDAAAKAAVQQSLDHPIQWHIALPRSIQKTLCGVYRLNASL